MRVKYAEKIKKLRKEKNITQVQLAEGISSQAMISKIEKKQISPDIDLLIKISQKLECSLIDLLSEEDDELYKYIYNLVSKREYKLLEQFFYSDSSIKNIKQNNLAFYKWIKGVIYTQNYKEYDKGISEMVAALDKSSDMQLKIRILIGLSALYSEIKKFDKSLDYLLKAEHLSTQIDIDTKLQQKINFQLARLYSVLEQFDNVVFYSKIAVQFAIKKDSMYLLDDLYLLLADSYLRTNQLLLADLYVDKSLLIAEIRTNQQLLPYIERTKNQIKSKI